MAPRAECSSLLLPLLVLLACSCSMSMVAAFGWQGPCVVGCERLAPRDSNSNNPHDNTPWGLAYMLPFGGRQEVGDRDRIRRLRPGSSPTIQCRRGTASHHPTSRGPAASSARAGGIKIAGRVRHRMNMLNNGGGEMEVFCDQCGDRFFTFTGGASSPSPPSPSSSFSSIDLAPHLAVCGAPNCGVSFSQCTSCNEEYAGCCSAACRALAGEQETASTAAPAMASGVMGMRVEQRLNGNDGEQLSGLGSAGSSSSSFSGAGVFQRQGATAVSMSARVSPPEEEGSNLDKGETPSGPSSTTGGGPNAEGSEGRGAEKGKGKRAEGGGESLLESYASRHSEAESSCLTAVREATTRSQPGGAHMVSGHLQGELLKLLVKLSGAKRVLDIGTFTGYSALAFAEALPEDGVVVTLESDARAADTAKGHFASSDHGGKIRLVLGKAMDGIDQMIAEDTPQFDIIFIDADKKRYWDYYDKLLSGPRPLLGVKGMLLADNVLFHELVPMADAVATTRAAAAAAAQPAQGAVEDTDAAQNPEKVHLAGEGDEVVDKLEPSVSGRREENRRKQPLGVVPANLGVVVGGGVLPATPRRMKIAESLDGFNKRVKEDGRVEVVMLPLRDGLSVVTWRRGGYPTADGQES